MVGSSSTSRMRLDTGMPFSARDPDTRTDRESDSGRPEAGEKQALYQVEGYERPYLRILSWRVDREMPRSLAAWLRFPDTDARTSRM